MDVADAFILVSVLREVPVPGAWPDSSHTHHTQREGESGFQQTLPQTLRSVWHAKIIVVILQTHTPLCVGEAQRRQRTERQDGGEMEKCL